MATLNYDQICEKVRECIADSLAVDVEDVRPDSRLFDDLGANSLDFIDIVFLLERELGLKAQDTEFNFIARLDFSSPEVLVDGHLTPQTAKALAAWLPELQKRFPDLQNIAPRELFSCITVDAVCGVVERGLQEA